MFVLNGVSHPRSTSRSYLLRSTLPAVYFRPPPATIRRSSLMSSSCTIVTFLESPRPGGRVLSQPRGESNRKRAEAPRKGTSPFPTTSAAPTQKRPVDSLAALRLIRHRSRGGLTGGLPRAGEPADLLCAREIDCRRLGSPRNSQRRSPDARDARKVIIYSKLFEYLKVIAGLRSSVV
jgi:hypothetical protein